MKYTQLRKIFFPNCFLIDLEYSFIDLLLFSYQINVATNHFIIWTWIDEVQMSWSSNNTGAQIKKEESTYKDESQTKFTFTILSQSYHQKHSKSNGP